ncbi:MAG: ArsJ-associated glyceraldehyde-3-phosphate dehydrogenase [Verrucomicrobiota bacterium]
MSVRIGINGFGRIGRLAFRSAWNWPEFEIVYVNDPGGVQSAAHLLEFDSLHGRWKRDIAIEGQSIVIDGKPIAFATSKNLSEAPWKPSDVDIMIESSGLFRTTETLAPYFESGIKKVIVAAPVKLGALNVVMGVNDYLYDPTTHNLLTAASCTTNCLAPVVKVIRDGLGIKHGSITTIHDITNTQVIVDKPHKDLRRARAASLSLIPTTTGSATAITQIYPELTGKLNGHAVRVPLLTGSLTDCVFEVDRPTTVEEVNQLLKTAAEGELAGILGYEEKPLVGIDYVGDPRSSIIDALSTMVVNQTQVKIYAWYDNEFGYANRLAELVRKVAGNLKS